MHLKIMKKNNQNRNLFYFLKIDIDRHLSVIPINNCFFASVGNPAFVLLFLSADRHKLFIFLNTLN